MYAIWRGLRAEIVDLLLPVVCAGCGAGCGATGHAASSTAHLCGRCDAALVRLPAEACTLCQARAGRPGEPRGRCGPCVGARGPLVACLAAASFEGDVASWIRRFKYPAPGLAGLDPGAEAVVAALLAEASARALGLPSAVHAGRGLDSGPAVPEPGARPWLVPVPLHPARLRARGFEPAALLARGLARKLGLGFAPEVLHRVRDTPSQTGLGRAGRRRNVAGAFRSVGPAPGPWVWLVDDVVTTGATLEEAARALRRAGVRAVLGLAAARTPGSVPGGAFAALPVKGYIGEPASEEPAMATITEPITLKHRANLGEEADEIRFESGDEVAVLKVWAESALCKNDDGLLFNIPKPHLDLGG